MDNSVIKLADHERDNSDTFGTGWKNEPTVTDLKQDLTDASPAHSNHVANVEVWLDNLNITGKAKFKKRKGKSAIVPKLIRKQAEWRYASLSEPFLSTDDLFNTFPVTHEDKKGAIQNGLVLNNQFNTKLQKTKFIDEFVRTVVDEGTAIVRVGWDFEEEEQEVEVPDFQVVPIQDPAMVQQVQQASQMLQQGGPEAQKEIPPELMEAIQLSQQAGYPVQKMQVGSHMEKQMVTVKNQPTLEICDYNNVIVDPTCNGDFTKAEFVIYSFETSLSELEKDGRYKNLDQINVENNSSLTDAEHESQDDSSFNFTDKPRKRFVAYEYWGKWDIHKTGITTPFIATWAGNTIIRMEENPYPDQQVPFVGVQYLPVRKSTYGEPDGELLEDNQLVVGAVTRGMIDIMGRSANGQVGSRKDALDLTNKRKFDRGDDYEYNAQVDPRMAFHMHTFPEIPKSAEFMLNMQNAEAESLTGVKSFSQGISGQALGSTATGIRSALDATAKRELGILRRLAEGVKQIGRKIVAMNAEFLSDEETIRITNEEFVEVRRDDLAGNFDLVLEISTAEADNDKAQELAFMLQTMGNNMDPSMSKMILIDIARLRKMPELAKRLEEYEPQPDPIAQEKAQLENELLKAQIQNEMAKAQENAANAELDNAKAATEEAKVRNLGSDSDLKDLDFVEQESGVNRKHDMDKMEVDAGKQMDLKAADGINQRMSDQAKENQRRNEKVSPGLHNI